jgi:hypothetical protein
MSTSCVRSLRKRCPSQRSRMSLGEAQKRCLSLDVIRQHAAPLELIGLMASEGGSERVEIMVTVKGCHAEPCRLLLNLSRADRDTLEAELRKALQDALHTHTGRGSRAELQWHDLSVAGREIVQVRVDFGPERRSADTLIRAKRSPSHRRLVGVSGRGQGAGDARGRRGPVHPGRNDPRGEECRQGQRGGARQYVVEKGKRLVAMVK